jgi:hypothetical protein
MFGPTINKANNLWYNMMRNLAIYAGHLVLLASSRKLLLAGYVYVGWREQDIHTELW